MKVLILALALIAMGFSFGMGFAQEEPKVIETVIYRYPNTPPYEEFDDPIDFEQALVLLYGMRASHIQALNWTFEENPGFGIADREFQERVIKWYDQLIDFVQREAK